MENQIKFTKEQLQIAINHHLEQERGLNELLSMVINGLMYSERESFLKSNPTKEKNKGNGYRKVYRSGIGKQLELKIPRDRLGVFKPVIYGIINEQESKIQELCFSLYSKGLTTRQIEDVIEELYGSHYSKSTLSRINVEFKEYIEQWLNRKLSSYYPVIFIDAMYVNVRRDTVSNEAFYMVLGLKEDYTREVLGIYNFPTESASGWEEVLKNLQERGVEHVGLFVSDDLKGLNEAISRFFKASKRQKCVLHFMKNLSKNIRVDDRKAFCSELKEVFNPDNPAYRADEALRKLKEKLDKWRKKYPVLNHTYQRTDLELLFTYLNYDYRVRRMLYTTNWIERLNKSCRRTLKIRNALPTVQSAITLIASVCMEMQEKVYKYPIVSFRYENKL